MRKTINCEYNLFFSLQTPKEIFEVSITDHLPDKTSTANLHLPPPTTTKYILLKHASIELQKSECRSNWNAAPFRSSLVMEIEGKRNN